MNYDETLFYIHSINWRGSKLGLARVTELLHRLGDPQNSLRFIHVAGTNGKGSTCAMLDSILRVAGYKTGLYTSPYIERFNERMQIDGQPISDEELCAITAQVREHAESMSDLPTEFEIVSAIAFLYFATHRCDVVVLEVGLGGRLDATNVIGSPMEAVITAIDFDHMEYLGDTLAKIAAEKCGIIKPGCAVVSYRQPEQAMAVVQDTCERLGVPLRVVDFSAIRLQESTLDGQVFDFDKYREMRISLLGEHQLYNAAVAMTAVEVLNERGLCIPEEAMRKGLDEARWPARFEVVGAKPTVIVDGGHNPQGAHACAEAIRRYIDRPVVLLVGLLRDKDRAGMMATLNEVATQFVATRPDNPRALAAADLAAELAAFGKPVEVNENIEEACAAACRKAVEIGGVVVAVGSLYMAGSVRRYFLDRGDAVERKN